MTDKSRREGPENLSDISDVSLMLRHEDASVRAVMTWDGQDQRVWDQWRQARDAYFDEVLRRIGRGGRTYA